MATFTITNNLNYSPSLVNTDNTESAVQYYWELRTGYTTTVEASGNGSSTWNGSNWTTGAIDVGTAATSAGSSFWYQLTANDTVPGVSCSASTALVSGGFITFVPITQKCYSLPDSPFSWYSDTWVEDSWTEITVPASDSGLDTSEVYVTGNLNTDQYADIETTLVIEKGSTTKYISLPANYSGTWTSSVEDFSSESADGTWRIYFQDSYGGGGADIIDAELCIGPAPAGSLNILTSSETPYNTQDDGQLDGGNYWVNFELTIVASGNYDIYTTDFDSTGIDTYLELWDDTTFSGTLIDSNDDSSGLLAEILTVWLTPGTYGVRCRLFSGGQSTDNFGILYY